MLCETWCLRSNFVIIADIGIEGAKIIGFFLISYRCAFISFALSAPGGIPFGHLPGVIHI